MKLKAVMIMKILGFHYANVSLGKLWQLRKILDFFNPVNLSFLQLVSYKKVFHAICNIETDRNIVLRKNKFFVFW